MCKEDIGKSTNGKDWFVKLIDKANPQERKTKKVEYRKGKARVFAGVDLSICNVPKFPDGEQPAESSSKFRVKKILVAIEPKKIVADESEKIVNKPKKIEKSQEIIDEPKKIIIDESQEIAVEKIEIVAEKIEKPARLKSPDYPNSETHLSIVI